MVVDAAVVIDPSGEPTPRDEAGIAMGTPATEVMTVGPVGTTGTGEDKKNKDHEVQKW